tara:strand:- start:153 stop:539 length:387 start_codon:yes stop_codon:yes gene_type:complete
MICKIFFRTFPSPEECDLFEAILQTRWPKLLEGTKGVIFTAYRNKKTPNISTVVWTFPNQPAQEHFETLIAEHIKKFTETLSPTTTRSLVMRTKTSPTDQQTDQMLSSAYPHSLLKTDANLLMMRSYG